MLRGSGSQDLSNSEQQALLLELPSHRQVSINTSSANAPVHSSLSVSRRYHVCGGLSVRHK
jgi:hypothetical protein